MGLRPCRQKRARRLCASESARAGSHADARANRHADPDALPEPTATPEADSEAKDDETPAPNAVSGETLYDEPRLVRTLKRANLRKKPDGSRLGVVAADTALNAIGEVERDGELWLHIEKGKDNKEGYILAELLRQVRPVKLLPVAEGEVREMFP